MFSSRRLVTIDYKLSLFTPFNYLKMAQTLAVSNLISNSLVNTKWLSGLGKVVFNIGVVNASREISVLRKLPVVKVLLMIIASFSAPAFTIEQNFTVSLQLDTHVCTGYKRILEIV